MARLTEHRHFPLTGIFFAIILVLLVHGWDLPGVPRGLFTDEAAFGYNAILLGQTGMDEHGHVLPAVLESYGDAKSALYGYAVACIFLIFGASDATLRLTSTLLYGLFLVGLVLLMRQLFPKRHQVAEYSILAAAFLPWFFTVSRIGFEVVSQLPTTIWSLYFVHRAFEDKTSERRLLHAALAGLMIGLSVYSYATARLLSLLFLICVLICYARPGAWKRCLLMIITSGITVIPYVWFAIAHPGMVTGRFKGISYLSDATLSLWDKIVLFTQTYGQHLSLDFLLLNGDNNTRHATGHGGEMFIGVLALACLGIIMSIGMRTLRRDRFVRLLLLLLVCSPIAAALTREAIPHSLRSILLGLYLVLFSCIGMFWILERKWVGRERILAALFCLLIAGESLSYVWDYFGRYRLASASAFDNYGMHEALEKAYAQSPERVIVSEGIDYAQYEFFTRTVQNPTHVPVGRERASSVIDTCLIYLPSDQESLRASPLPYSEMQLSGSIVRLRCYTN